jgi:DNA-binding NarL/FixJ family response regulator
VFLSPAIAATLGPLESNHLIRVLAVDRNPLMREGLALLIRLQPDMQLVTAVATAAEALEVYFDEQPDVTVMDLDAPSAAAVEAIRKIRARNSMARVIGLTTYAPDDVWAEALAAGACQCLGKDRLSDNLLRTIRNGTP